MKRGIWPLILFSLVPSVLAQDNSIFGDAFSLIFGPVSSAGNDMALKVGLWLAMIFILFQGAQKIFKHKDINGFEVANKKIAIVFAILISTISVRFMPPEWAAALGTITWISVVILLPYTLISFVSESQWVRIIGTGVVVLFMTILLSGYGAPTVFPFIRGSRFFSEIFYLLTPQYYLASLIFSGVIIILMFIFFANRGSPGGDGGSSSGPGLFSNALGGIGKAIAAPFKALGHGISGVGKGVGYAGQGLGKGIGGIARGTGQLGGAAIGKGVPAAARGIARGAAPVLGSAARGAGAVLKGAGQLGGAAIGKGVPAAASGAVKGAKATGRGLKRFGGWMRNKLRRTPKKPGFWERRRQRLAARPPKVKPIGEMGGPSAGHPIEHEPIFQPIPKFQKPLMKLHETEPAATVPGKPILKIRPRLKPSSGIRKASYKNVARTRRRIK